MAYAVSASIPDSFAQGRVLDEATFRRLLRRTTRTLLMALVMPLLISLGLVGYLQRSAHRMDRSDRIISAINNAERLLTAMQNGFRGFQATAAPENLATFSATRHELAVQLQEVEKLVSGNLQQQENLRRFQQQAGTWSKTAEGALARIAAGQPAESEATSLLASREMMNAAMVGGNILINEEERLQSKWQHSVDQVVNGIMILFVLSGLVGIPALSLWLRGLLREVNRSYQASLTAALRRANELQVTLRSIGDAVVATDEKGRVEFMNPSAERLLGWSNEEARGRPLPEVFVLANEETGVIAENPVERVLREDIVVGFRNRMVLHARDGSSRAIEDSASPIRGEKGEVLGVILVFHDVSAKRETERLLEQSGRRLAFLNDLGEATRLLTEPVEIMSVATRLLGEHLQASRCAYAEVDANGDRFNILTDYTDGCASIAGEYSLALFGPRTEAELRAGRTFVLRDVEAEIEPAAGAAMFRAVEVRAVVCRPLIKQGRLRALMAVHQTHARIWTMAEIKLVEEVVERCWSTIERARAEAAVRVAKAEAETMSRNLAEAAERFRLISGVISLQVWTAKLNGDLDYANQECSQYFGADVEREILGNAWTQFVHPEDLSVALDSWLSSISTGLPYQVEFRLRNRTGVYRWFLVRAVAMRDSHGRIAKWFGTNTDIDDLKRAKAQAEQASRAKDDFLAALSHELRTPLTPVLMTAAALREDERLSLEVREQLGMMERNIALEARLIDDLLDLTSIARGKLHLRAVSCDAHSLISLAIEIVRDDAQLKGISIERRFTAHRSGLTVDPARFQQVIWNLLRNAVKFTPQRGIITISTAEKPVGSGAPWLEILVTDSGIGIEAGMLDKIFRPFDQGNLAGDHRFGGMGLGLAIARAVVDLHGGKISARSEGVNLGATFVVELPGAVSPPPAIIDQSQLSLRIMSGSTPPMSMPAAAKLSLRLLLIEDHEATLQVLLRLLTREGHRVMPARGVVEALNLAAANTFDLVISDLGLPDGTGIELMEKLRATYALRGIALSGYGMEDDLARSREAGFAAHLIKPVDFPQLRLALDTLSRE